MQLDDLHIAVIGLLIAGIVKGVSGLGYASCALPFLALALGLKAAMAVVLVPVIATNISLALLTGHFREIVSSYRIMYLAMLPGVGVGVGLLHWVDQGIAVKCLGLIIFAYVAFALAKPDLSMPRSWRAILQMPTGFFNGVITGLTGAQVMPLFPYVMALKLDPDRTVQVINIAVLISTSFLAAGLVATGILTHSLFVVSLLAVIPAVVGTLIGNRLRQRLPVAFFRRCVLSTLLVVAVVMIAR